MDNVERNNANDVHTIEQEKHEFLSRLSAGKGIMCPRWVDVSDELCHTRDKRTTNESWFWKRCTDAMHVAELNENSCNRPLHNGQWNGKEKNSRIWVRWDSICTENFFDFKFFLRFESFWRFKNKNLITQQILQQQRNRNLTIDQAHQAAMNRFSAEAEHWASIVGRRRLGRQRNSWLLTERLTRARQFSAVKSTRLHSFTFVSTPRSSQLDVPSWISSIARLEKGEHEQKVSETRKVKAPKKFHDLLHIH